ncbi:Crp/Fnr family transcriptional regulator [Peribacillus sp. SCS-155]|uniref:Crp/Fnr family transcriptional regulator n=1 Tax=Peribacillus sedimenti TaxID=3115297 RepID=UPI00390655AF
MWLGIQSLEAGWHKVADGFDTAGFLKGAIAQAGGERPAVAGWYTAVLKHGIANEEVINFMITWGELLVGIGLVLGAATIPALLAGVFINLNFTLAGTTSTNPAPNTVVMILLFAGTGEYYYGADRYIIPFIKRYTDTGPKNNDSRPAMHH